MKSFNPEKIKVVVWDLDGTIFFSPEAARDIYEAHVKVLARSSGLPANEARVRFAEVSRFYRWGDAVAKLTNRGQREIAAEVENEVSRQRYARKDNRLLKIFGKMKNVRHLVLTNANKSNTEAVLKKIGFSARRNGKPGLIEKLYTLDSTAELKPHPQAFRQILEYTRIEAAAHLVIGDTWETDILPAIKLDFRTCLVGTAEPAKRHLGDLLRGVFRKKLPDPQADLYLRTIYDLEKFF